MIACLADWYCSLFSCGLLYNLTCFEWSGASVTHSYTYTHIYFIVLGFFCIFIFVFCFYLFIFFCFYFYFCFLFLFLFLFLHVITCTCMFTFSRSHRPTCFLCSSHNDVSTRETTLASWQIRSSSVGRKGWPTKMKLLLTVGAHLSKKDVTGK